MTAGRPTKFKEEYIEQAEKLSSLGATDIEIADFFNVDVRTIHRWKLESDKFCHSIRVAKEEADKRVVRSLYARASGYEHDEVDIRVVNGQIVETPIRKYYPPDATSMIFWLKNRRPAEWRDKQDIEHTGKDGAPIQVAIDATKLSSSALAEILAARDAADKG
jgi:hypothetical protein